MTDLRQAAQQALEALASYSVGERLNASQVNDLIAQLEAALEQPEQEPVAWLKEDWTGGHLNYEESVYEGGHAAFPVYKHSPAAQRPWQGLTDEEITEIYEMGLGVRASIEITLDKIEELNHG